MKHHPHFRRLLSGKSSERLAYGARVLNEGGLQSVPRLSFPGGALMGCSAGFVNVAKIKGTHNAMKTGMLAAESAYEAVHGKEGAGDLSSYERAFKTSWVYQDLKEVRNLRPSFNTALGIWGGIVYSGIDSLLLKGRTPWTFRHGDHGVGSLDSRHTEAASRHKPIEYPGFEPPLSTDLMTSVSLTGTNHAEDQPVHLRVATTAKYMNKKSPACGAGSEAVETCAEGKEVEEEEQRRREHVRINVEEYGGLLGRACPAGVYEYVESGLVINSQVRVIVAIAPIYLSSLHTELYPLQAVRRQGTDAGQYATFVTFL